MSKENNLTQRRKDAEKSSNLYLCASASLRESMEIATQ
jgi:hypothetical protein